MKKRVEIIVIFLFILINISLTSAKSIIVDYPDEVNCGEDFSFSVELIDFPQDVYDVKIDIFGNGKRISRIYDGNWKSTNYYVNDIIDSGNEYSAEFMLNITEKYDGEADITVKVRNSKEAVSEFKNYTIQVYYEEEKESGGETEDKENGEIEEEGEEDDNEENKAQSSAEISSQDNYEKTIIPEEKLETIKLNYAGKDLKEWKSRNEKIKEYSIYGFTLFLLASLIGIIIYNGRKNRQDV